MTLPRLALIMTAAALMAGFADAARRRGDQDLAVKQRRLAEITARLERARDSLEEAIAARWDAKQRHVRQREIDRERIGSLETAQERAYADLARVKEEAFAQRRMIEDQQHTLRRARESWRMLDASIEEIYRQEADHLATRFPLDREQRRLRLENLRREHARASNISAALRDFTRYRIDWMHKGLELRLVGRTVFVEDSGALDLTVARFGHVFAFGADGQGPVYTIRQTGRMGPGRFVVEPIGNPAFTARLRELFPRWIAAGAIAGDIPVDVLHNEQSRYLVSGEEVGATEAIVAFIRKGGVIMAPLLALPLWALALIVYKFAQLASRKRRVARDGRAVLAALRAGRREEARTYAGARRSAPARIATLCLENAQWDRATIEKAVRGVLLEEAPALNRYLGTLAVIAAVAPLLGLLGTVTGMISLFEVITHYGTGDPKIMAGGISEALVTTQTGLAAAIPILLVHNYLRTVKMHIQAMMERDAIDMVNLVRPGEVRAARPKPAEA